MNNKMWNKNVPDEELEDESEWIPDAADISDEESGASHSSTLSTPQSSRLASISDLNTPQPSSNDYDPFKKPGAVSNAVR